MPRKQLGHKETERMTFRLPGETAEKIRIEADNLGLDKSELIRRVLEGYFKGFVAFREDEDGFLIIDDGG